MAVHPDKNRDGRAQEAFIAVENAASILSDEGLRAEYDKQVRSSTMERRQGAKELVINTASSVLQMVVKVLKAIHAVLGPFATPVIIIGALLI
jgi:DnaJ-class molecular chaperone